MPHHLASLASRHQGWPAPQKATGLGVIAFLALVVHRLRRSGSRAASIFSGAVDLGFIAVAVLILLTPFVGRSVWRGLGLNRTGLRLWPVTIVVPVAVAATGYLVVLAASLCIRASEPEIASKGGPSDAGRGPMPKDPRDRARRNSDIVPHRVIDSDPVPQPPLPARMPNGED